MWWAPGGARLLVGPSYLLRSTRRSALRPPEGSTVSTADQEGDDVAQSVDGDAAASVRFLAHDGQLAKRASEGSADELALLRRGAYEIVWLVVFDGLTRGIERQRG